MKYRVVLQITDDAGNETEEVIMPATTAERGWRCSHAIWPAWSKPEGVEVCGYCHEPLVACEIVECPWCEQYLTTDAVLEHWREGCNE